MTTEDRLAEINDYCRYLDALYAREIAGRNTKMILLGFSQGTGTATRWLHQTKHSVNHLVLYAGEIASDLRDPVSPRIQALPLTYVTGNNDPFLTPEKTTDVRRLMKSLGADIIEFEGGHEVKPEVLLRVRDRMVRLR
jgi:predicted esterase